MDHLHQLRKFYELQKVERANSVAGRTERLAGLDGRFLAKKERALDGRVSGVEEDV